MNMYLNGHVMHGAVDWRATHLVIYLVCGRRVSQDCVEGTWSRLKHDPQGLNGDIYTTVSWL